MGGDTRALQPITVLYSHQASTTLRRISRLGRNWPCLLSCLIVSKRTAEDDLSTTCIFSRNYHKDWGRRTAQVFRIRIRDMLRAPCRNSFAWQSVWLEMLVSVQLSATNNSKWLQAAPCSSSFVGPTTHASRNLRDASILSSRFVLTSLFPSGGVRRDS